MGVALCIMDWFEVLGALDDAPDDASTASSSALAASTDVIQSFTPSSLGDELSRPQRHHVRS